LLSNQEKLLELNKSIQRELKQQIEQVDRDIEQYREDRLQVVEDEVVSDCYRYIQKSTAKIRLEYTTERSHAVAELRRNLLLKRDEYVELIFSEVKKQLLRFTESEEYPDFLRRRFMAAVSDYRLQKPLVSVCERDLKYADIFCRILPDTQVEASPAISIGGFTAAKSGQAFILNETLDNTLSEQREWFYSHCGLRISQF
jgi:vacuolar-type H+-ATPase subunit E/Vma4